MQGFGKNQLSFRFKTNLGFPSTFLFFFFFFNVLKAQIPSYLHIPSFYQSQPPFELCMNQNNYKGKSHIIYYISPLYYHLIIG